VFISLSYIKVDPVIHDGPENPAEIGITGDLDGADQVQGRRMGMAFDHLAIA